MKLDSELAGFSPEKDTALTIGVFDGVHLGHKHLISRLREKASESGLLSGVITFYSHPEEVLGKKDRVPYLTGVDEKVRLLKEEGVDIVVPLAFTPELAGLSAGEFTGLLRTHLRMRALVIGPDFAMGKNREGTFEVLARLGAENGFSVSAVKPVEKKGGTVSSTAIRRALKKGDMEKVSALLGRTFTLEGKVAGGENRGAGLGFPTANLETDSGHIIPGDGVYATLASFDGNTCRAVTNIGTNPTFGNAERTIETFIIDFSGDLYGRTLKIDFIGKLRDEKRFATPDELKKQMTEDVKKGIMLLDGRA